MDNGREDHLGKYKKAVQEEFELRSGSAEKVFQDAEEAAAEEIVHLAQSADSPNLRFRAASYILDSVVFKRRDNEDELSTLLDKMRSQEG